MDVLVLVIGICVCVILTGIVVEIIVRGEPLTSESAELLTSMIIGLISILSLYVGAKIVRRNNRRGS